LAGQLGSAVLAEDALLMPAPRTDVQAHVLHDTEHRHVDLLEHLEPLRASANAMSCGVVTITAPLTGTRWANVS